MSWLRAKRTMEFPVRKYGAYCSVSISRSSCFKVATTLSGTPRAFPRKIFQRLLRSHAGDRGLSGYW
jgi:hypothetical protein